MMNEKSNTHFPQPSHFLVKHHIFWYNLGFPKPLKGNQVRHILIITIIILVFLVSYWWIRRTRNITSIGLFYKEVGRLNEMCILFLIHHPLASISFRCSFFSFRFLPSSRKLFVISLNLLPECYFIREK